MSENTNNRLSSVYLYMSAYKPHSLEGVSLNVYDLDLWTLTAFEKFAADSGFGSVPPCEVTQILSEEDAPSEVHSWRVDFLPASNEAFRFTRWVLSRDVIPLYDLEGEHFADLGAYPF